MLVVAAFGCTRLTAAQFKSRQLKNKKRETEGRSETDRKGDKDVQFICVRTRTFVTHRMNLIIHT